MHDKTAFSLHMFIDQQFNGVMPQPQPALYDLVLMRFRVNFPGRSKVLHNWTFRKTGWKSPTSSCHGMVVLHMQLDVWMSECGILPGMYGTWNILVSVKSPHFRPCDLN